MSSHTSTAVARLTRRGFLLRTGSLGLVAGLTSSTRALSSTGGPQPSGYDYIVVGAGSAGSVIAARLTEDPSARVLLLEAGGLDDSNQIRNPSDYYKNLGSQYDWKFATEPEAGLGNRSVPWPRGKVLGGSSSINAMLYMRGNRLDYDNWNYLGNAGWAYKDVLPLFKKSEHNLFYQRTPEAKKYHGHSGPLTVVNPPWRSAAGEAFVRGAGQKGFKTNPDLWWDFNGGEQVEAAGFFQLTLTPKGQRNSAATAFLHPAMSRPNLTVVTEAFVQRVLWDGPRRVVGVTYLRGGRIHRVIAEREVVLCAGSVMSPVILMHSGIGPADQLRKVRIRPTVDAPGVGQNLQDHFIYAIDYEATKRFVPPVASGSEGTLFHRTRPGMSKASPDLQYHFWYDNFEDRSTFSFAPNLTQPASTGTVTLRSGDPADKPMIQANYLQVQTDIDVMIYSLKLAREIVHTKAFDEIRKKEVNPGPEVKTDEDMVKFIRRVGRTIYHPVGTCKMGSDRMAVVDDRLRVHGVEGLRVADASIMPRIVAGNTNAPTIMIGEKAAELIRVDSRAMPPGPVK